MSYLINHFEKVLVIFIVVMVLIIPNMNVYSFVGRHETSSQAIMANELYKSSRLAADLPRPVPLLAAIGIAVAIIVSLGTFVAGMGIGAAVAIATIETNKGTLSLISKYDEKDYQRHDFSKFDN